MAKPCLIGFVKIYPPSLGLLNPDN